jgi:hypothetical protein
VHREVAGLDVEVASSRETEHVLTLGVPGHTVGIWFLRGRDVSACEDHPDAAPTVQSWAHLIDPKC